MSHQHSAWVADHVGELLQMTYTDSSGKEQAVVRGQYGLAALVVFAGRAGESDGEAFPSVRGIARDLKVDPKNMRQAVEALVAGGLLVDTGRTRGQATVFQVLPGLVTLKKPKNTTPTGGGSETTTPAVSGGTGGGVGGGVGGGIGGGSETPTTGQDSDDENPSAARASAETERGKIHFSVDGTMNPRTPNQSHDMLDQSRGDTAGGENKQRIERIAATAVELDQSLNGALNNPRMKQKRHRELCEQITQALAEYPTASDSALANLAVCRVHGTDPDRDLVTYLEDQQAAAVGLVTSDYSDPDTEPDWWALADDDTLDHEPAPALEAITSAAATVEEQNTSAMLEARQAAFRAAQELKRNGAALDFPAVGSVVGGYVHRMGTHPAF